MNHILKSEYEIKWSYDPNSYEGNFSSWVEMPENVGLPMGFKPMTLRCQKWRLLWVQIFPWWMNLWFISYITSTIDSFISGNFGLTNNQLSTSEALYLSWLERRRTGIARSQVTPRWTSDFFRFLYRIAKIAFTTARIIASPDFNLSTEYNYIHKRQSLHKRYWPLKVL